MDELACAKNQTKKEGQMKIKVNRGLDRKKVSFLPHFVAFLFKQLLVEVVGAWGLIEARIVSTFLILTSHYTRTKTWATIVQQLQRAARAHIGQKHEEWP